MAYIYRFKDVNDKIIYVGYTGRTMSERMQQHFTKGHLPKECYKSVARIEYQYYKTKSDAQIMETYCINKYKPKFNKLNKQKDTVTFDLDNEKEWKLYRVLKAPKNKIKYNGKFEIILLIIYLIAAAIIYFSLN